MPAFFLTHILNKKIMQSVTIAQRGRSRMARIKAARKNIANLATKKNIDPVALAYLVCIEQRHQLENYLQLRGIEPVEDDKGLIKQVYDTRQMEINEFAALQGFAHDLSQAENRLLKSEDNRQLNGEDISRFINPELLCCVNGVANSYDSFDPVTIMSLIGGSDGIKNILSGVGNTLNIGGIKTDADVQSKYEQIKKDNPPIDPATGTPTISWLTKKIAQFKDAYTDAMKNAEDKKATENTRKRGQAYADAIDAIIKEYSNYISKLIAGNNNVTTADLKGLQAVGLTGAGEIGTAIQNVLGSGGLRGGGVGGDIQKTYDTVVDEQKKAEIKKMMPYLIGGVVLLIVVFFMTRK